jgi:hypothetical protein
MRQTYADKELYNLIKYSSDLPVRRTAQAILDVLGSRPMSLRTTEEILFRSLPDIEFKIQPRLLKIIPTLLAEN